MDEASKVPNAGFETLQRDLGVLSEKVATYIRSQI